ncbi:hypothetical protein B0O80DRAFT_445828 [Mortierella sp. GBAus27b]|nr:hypothetical protein B0O80DRAFT_445828 [Mortierella sp. GBAus27b]
MRPPRNISGSTSAAAAAAVRQAVATAAAASAQSGAGISFNTVGMESNVITDQGALQPKQEDQGSSINMEISGTRPQGLLARRASVSGQLMRVDDPAGGSTDTPDNSKRRRSLLSSSSSPTSLRTLFAAGAADARPSPSSTSQPAMPAETLDSKNSTESILADQASVIQDSHSDLKGNINGSARLDYFDQPLPYSGSSSSSSTPSGVMVPGVPHYGYPFESVAHLISPLSSPLCHAQSSSMPPTPLHLVTESLPDSVLTGQSSAGIGRFTPGHSQIQTPPPHPRHSAPRRASSSSYLPSHQTLDNDTKVHHDRRTSAPWGMYSHSQALHYDGRSVQAMPGPNGIQGQQYGAIHSHIHGEDIQPYPTQSALMRSNSTPAALRSPLKSLNRNRHSALPSRRSHIGPARQSLTLYASTDKVIQDLSLPQQLYRNSALPQRHNSNMSHLQFQLHIQQLQQQSQQQSQRSQSLPRYQPEQAQHPMLHQPQQGVVQWQTYGVPRQLQQETDLHFDLGTNNPQPDLTIGTQPTPLVHGMQSPDAFTVLPSADIMSPVSIHSPVQPQVADPQPIAGPIGTRLQSNLPENANSMTGISMVNHDLMAQQPAQQPSQEEQLQSNLQFAPGYLWKQDESTDRIAQGHTRHQSASQVYPQQCMPVQASAHNRSNWTRSLQGNLTSYTATFDHQQRLTDHAQILQKETPVAHPPTIDQNGTQDTFGASLALDLSDHLRLLDDELSQQSQVVSPHISKDTLSPSSGIAEQTEQTLVGSPTTPIQVHPPARSLISTIAGSSPQNQVILGGSGGAGMLHFQGNPYIDTLSFLDLPGTYMTSTAGMSAAGPSAASTSSSLPNSSLLNHQGERLYHSFVQQQPVVPNLHTQLAHIPQGQQHPPPQQPAQHINIIHHQHHHHHHHHIH